jgi:hypothetical protein
MDIFLLLGQSIQGIGKITDTSIPDIRILNMDMNLDRWMFARPPSHKFLLAIADV